MGTVKKCASGLLESHIISCHVGDEEALLRLSQVWDIGVPGHVERQAVELDQAEEVQLPCVDNGNEEDESSSGLNSSDLDIDKHLCRMIYVTEDNYKVSCGDNYRLSSFFGRFGDNLMRGGREGRGRIL